MNRRWNDPKFETAGYIINSYIESRGDESVYFGNGTKLNGYAVVPIERFKKIPDWMWKATK